jgi:branched-subunit amino acid ABC-type transport system permease component
MDISLLFAQFMSGLARGMMFFLIASGLSLIFGVMNILNFAHATLWLAGAYFCYTFWHLMQDYGFGLWVSIALASLVMAAVGWVIKLTFGVEDRVIVRPALVAGPIFLFGTPFDSYFVFVILLGMSVAAGLWWFLKKTRYGHIVRAAVFSREMVSALGIRIPRIYTGVFVLGVFIAGLAGAAQAPVGSITLGMDMAVVVQAFCVVVIGGFGSLLGTFVGAMIVGEVYSFSILFWPEGALVLIFVVTAFILIVRPWGLFGTPMRT